MCFVCEFVWVVCVSCACLVSGVDFFGCVILAGRFGVGDSVWIVFGGFFVVDYFTFISGLINSFPR